MVSVYAKRNMKKNEMVGWFSMGLNSSGPEEVAHWADVRDLAKGELLARWHVLVDSWFEQLGQSSRRGSALGILGFATKDKSKSKKLKEEVEEVEVNRDIGNVPDKAVAVNIEAGLELDFV